MKTLLLGWLLLVTPEAVQAQFNYTVTSNQTVTITGYKGTDDVVAIPDTINGLLVTSIGDYAFEWTGLTSITIPNTVTNIRYYAFSLCSTLTSIMVAPLNPAFSSVDGVLFSKNQTAIFAFPTGRAGAYSIPKNVTSIRDVAFYDCLSLTSVTIPNGVTNIGHVAFAGCTSLTNVTIGEGVTNIAYDAFTLCSSLTSIMVDPLNPAYRSADGVLFSQSQTTLVQYPGGKVGHYTIPNSVTSIGADAFAYCFSLTSVTIPNSVISIGGSAFSECTSLSSVTIPSGVTSIGDWAFYGCSSLTSLYFQGNAPSVGGAFVFFGDTMTIYYLPGTAGWGSTFGEIPTALWTLPYPVMLGDGSGVETNGFGFTVSWATNASVVVEASPDLNNPNWSPVTTNALSGGTFYFADPQWTKYPSRFYRVRSQ